MKKKQYVVIGLGIFGSTVTKTLFENGQEVIALDIDMHNVERIADQSTRAIQCDTTDLHALQSIGIDGFDCAIVGIGSRLEDAILTVMNLETLNIKEIIVKAKTKQSASIMRKIGVTKVVRPERDTGEKLAKGLIREHIVEVASLEDGYILAEINVPTSWVSKTVRDINIRARYGFNIIGIRLNATSKLSMRINPEMIIQQENILLVAGEEQNLKSFDEKFK